MSEAGDLLELLHGAGERWTTVAATIRIWRHNELEQRARQRLDRDRGGGSIHVFIAGGGAPPSGEHEETISVWIAKPDRSRQEWADGVSVTRGRTWANYHPLHGYITNADQGDAGAGAPLDVFGHLLDPARLLSALSFDLPVSTDAGLLVRARPRSSARGYPVFGIGYGADEHELLVDPQRGVVLRAESRLEGDLFLRSDLLAPVFDEPLPDDLFTLIPPPGEEAVTPDELHANGLSVEDAAALASFAVYALGELPDGPWRLAASHTRARRHLPERVTLLYHRSDGRGHILVTELAATSEHEEWHAGSARTELELDGTRLILTSDDHEEDELRRLSETLAPA